MTELSFANKLYAHLDSGITSGQTTIPIVPGEIGNLWAGFKTGVYLYLAIMNELGQLEIVKVTSLNMNNTITVVRGQGGTMARAYAIGSPVAERFVAEQMNYFLQRGVFPSGGYNPNGVFTGNFNGEKFWQTGPAADQKRWWINAGGGNKWRLMTGDIYGNEYRDEEGFIIKPIAWELLGTADGISGSCFRLGVFNSKLYVACQYYSDLYEFDGINFSKVASTYPLNYDQIWDLLEFNSKLYGVRGKLLEWNGVDAWVGKTTGSEGGETLETDGSYIYTAGGDGKLYRWNGVNAWTQVAAKYQDGIRKLVYLDGSLYGATYKIFSGVGGRLFNFTGSAWGIVAGKYFSEEWSRDACIHNGKIYMVSGYNEGNLLEWNGVNAWDFKGQFDPVGGVGDMISVTTTGVDLYVYGRGAGGGAQWLSKWDGVDTLEKVIDPPDDPWDSFYDILYWNGHIYGAGAQGRLWRLEL